MKTIKNDEGTFIFLATEADVKTKKLIILVLSIFIILFDIWAFTKNGFNGVAIIFEAIILLFLIWSYHSDKNNSTNPILVMKNGILMNIICKQDINFNDIIKIEIPLLSYDLVATFLYHGQKTKQPIFLSSDILLSRLIAERIKEYADDNGFLNIEYNNCLLNEK